MDIDAMAKDIKKLSETRKTILVAIDGRSGSGKSTLANNLAEHIQGSQIIHLDDFDLYEDKNILEVIKRLESASQTSVIFVEGIFALRRPLLKFYDYKIWVEIPKEIGYKRGLQRDISLNGIDNSEKWENYWLPKEEEYIRSENPQEKANYVIVGNV